MGQGKVIFKITAEMRRVIPSKRRYEPG